MSTKDLNLPLRHASWDDCLVHDERGNHVAEFATPAKAKAAVAAINGAIDLRSAAETLLATAIDHWKQFDTDEPVNGADLVEWFAEFREEAKKVVR